MRRLVCRVVGHIYKPSHVVESADRRCITTRCLRCSKVGPRRIESTL